MQNTENNTPIQSTPAHRQTLLVYVASLIRTDQKNRHAAILEWGADNRVRLYVKDLPQSEYGVVFDCTPEEIRKFSSGMGAATLTLRDGRSFLLDFSPESGAAQLAAGGAALTGPIGLVFTTVIDQHATTLSGEQELEWWATNLTRFGVGGLKMTAKTQAGVNKAMWIGMGIFLGLIGLFILVAAAIFLISAMGIA